MNRKIVYAGISLLAARRAEPSASAAKTLVAEADAGHYGTARGRPAKK